jgi:hypothetical protein
LDEIAMLRRIRFSQIVPLFLALATVNENIEAQSQPHKFPLSKFDNGCRFKGRVQDCPGKVMQEILAGGKRAIPILISQLTDTARTQQPIEDHWSYTSSGDIAYFVLTDLFTDADWNTFNMPGVPDWTAIMKGCDSTAEGCWREYLHKHGRKSVQQAWLRAWSLWKDRAYWEPTALCFRISKE